MSRSVIVLFIYHRHKPTDLDKVISLVTTPAFLNSWRDGRAWWSDISFPMSGLKPLQSHISEQRSRRGPPPEPPVLLPLSAPLGNPTTSQGAGGGVAHSGTTVIRYWMRGWSVNNKLQMNWPNSRLYLGTCPKGVMKTTKYLHRGGLQTGTGYFATTRHECWHLGRED
jgi:hypothetical protein